MHEENVLSSWLRESTQGKAEEVEDMRKRTKEEETKSGNIVVEGEMERVTVDRERVCFEPLLCCLSEMFPRRTWWKGR